MRIAFVSDVVYPYVKGGVESMEASEMRELAKRNEVYCLSMRFPGMHERFVSHGVRHITVAQAPAHGLYTKRGTRSISAAESFARGLEAAFSAPGMRFDVMQVNMFPYLHLGAATAYCMRTGCKLVMDVAEVWDSKRWTEYLGALRGRMAHYYVSTSRAVRGADFYIANSSSTRDALVSLGIPGSKTAVFAPVLDMKYTRWRVRRKAHPMDVVIWGRLIKEKRIDMWLDAVAGARRLNRLVTGTIIGDGPERRTIERRIRELGLEGTVRLLPSIESRRALFGVIANSGVLLQMSEREGLSMTVLESLALGTPVILPNDTPIPREVKDMCEVSWIEDIPRKIVEVLEGSERRAYLPDMIELGRFSTAAIPRFYSQLFGKLRLPER